MFAYELLGFGVDGIELEMADRSESERSIDDRVDVLRCKPALDVGLESSPTIPRVNPRTRSCHRSLLNTTSSLSTSSQR